MQLLDIDSLLDCTRLSITAQPRALRRCLTNLLDNAVKYGRHAAVRLGEEPNQIVIRIRDGGAALGLKIARNIVEHHGGSLVLVSHPEGGLEAAVRLPLRTPVEKKPA